MAAPGSLLQDADRDSATVVLLDLASQLKASRRRGAEVPLLKGKAIALLFERPSTRTRSAFEVAAAQQGAASSYLDPETCHLGVRESIDDTGRVLGRMYDGIAFRARRHDAMVGMADAAVGPQCSGRQQVSAICARGGPPVERVHRLDSRHARPRLRRGDRVLPGEPRSRISRRAVATTLFGGRGSR